MHHWTALRAVCAFFFVFIATSAWSQGFGDEDISIEPEIVDVKALKLVPDTSRARVPALLPRPHLPLHGEQNDPGPAHLLLGDIPFSASTNPAASANSLWERIRGSFGMRELPSPLVKEWENWYASRPDYLARMIARSERYLFFVVEEVEKRGMPSEIALLPMIESAYNPKAYSHAHAAGMWQFIPSTGKHFGLRQNWWQDERRDVLAATRAALDYLEKLFEMFGSWELALASYNWGEGAVGRAIQRNEARGLRTDYLSLDMPAETRNYIPKLMAVKNILARPENFSFRLADIPNRPYFTVVHADRHIDVTLAARLAEMPLADFQALNPSHNRPVIRSEGAQPILLPTDRAERFQANLQAHGSRLTSWQSYRINQDDRLDQIAQRFGIPLAQLKEVNSIPTRLRNLVGLTILVPDNAEAAGGDISAAGFALPALAAALQQSAATVARYTVRRGDTLSSIAQRHNLTMAQLASRNGIRNGKVRIGQTLIVSEAAVRAASAAPEPVQRTAGKAPRRGASNQVARATPAAKRSTKTQGKAPARVNQAPSKPTQVALSGRRN